MPACACVWVYEKTYSNLSRSLRQVTCTCALSALALLLGLLDIFPLRLRASLTAESFLSVVLLPCTCDNDKI